MCCPCAVLGKDIATINRFLYIKKKFQFSNVKITIFGKGSFPCMTIKTWNENQYYFKRQTIKLKSYTSLIFRVFFSLEKGKLSNVYFYLIITFSKTESQNCQLFIN